MRIFRRCPVALPAVVCLCFTGARVGWAEPAHPDFYVEDPYAPHVTNGSTARLGTAVGFVYDQPTSVIALGLTAAIGQRFGRLALESEFDWFDFQTPGSVWTPLGIEQSNVSIGHGERVVALARYDVIRLGSHVVGPNSMLAVYGEGGGAIAWNHWNRPGALDLDQRVVPDATQRPEGIVGFGLTLDHRLQEPIGFPHRVAWFLGWRIEMTPSEPMTGVSCRGTSCRSVSMPVTGNYIDKSMLFQSSLAFTF